MARRNRRAPSGEDRPLGGAHQEVEEHGDGDWNVRRVTGASATKDYRCPGCDQEIRSGTPHVVAWPADQPAGEEYRRHWHTPCWNARGRRAPNTARGRGPAY
ncbi:MAG: ATP/GTP-binding protein [Actinomycetes bacterium]